MHRTFRALACTAALFAAEGPAHAQGFECEAGGSNTRTLVGTSGFEQGHTMPFNPVFLDTVLPPGGEFEFTLTLDDYSSPGAVFVRDMDDPFAPYLFDLSVGSGPISNGPISGSVAALLVPIHLQFVFTSADDCVGWRVDWQIVESCDIPAPGENVRPLSGTSGVESGHTTNASLDAVVLTTPLPADEQFGFTLVLDSYGAGGHVEVHDQDAPLPLLFEADVEDGPVSGLVAATSEPRDLTFVFETADTCAAFDVTWTIFGECLDHQLGQNERTLTGTSGLQSGSTMNWGADDVTLHEAVPPLQELAFTLTLDSYAMPGNVVVYDDDDLSPLLFEQNVYLSPGPIEGVIDRAFVARDLTFTFHTFGECVDWQVEWSLIDTCPGHSLGQNERTLVGTSGVESGHTVNWAPDSVVLHAHVPTGEKFAFKVTAPDDNPLPDVLVQDDADADPLLSVGDIENGVLTGTIDAVDHNRDLTLFFQTTGECVEWAVQWAIGDGLACEAPASGENVRTLVGASGSETGTTTSAVDDAVELHAEIPSVADLEFTLTLDDYASEGHLAVYDDDDSSVALFEDDVDGGPISGTVPGDTLLTDLTIVFETQGECVAWDFEWSMVEWCPDHALGENARILSGASGTESGQATVSQVDTVFLEVDVPALAEFPFTVTLSDYESAVVRVYESSDVPWVELFEEYADTEPISGVIAASVGASHLTLTIETDQPCVDWSVAWAIDPGCQAPAPDANVRTLVGATGLVSGTTTSAEADAVELHAALPPIARLDFTLALDDSTSGGLLTVVREQEFGQPVQVLSVGVVGATYSGHLGPYGFPSDLTFAFETSDECVEWEFDWSIEEVCPGHELFQNERFLEGTSGVESGQVAHNQVETVELHAEVPPLAELALTATFDEGAAGRILVRESGGPVLWSADLDGTGSTSGVIDAALGTRFLNIVFLNFDQECVDWQVEWALVETCDDRFGPGQDVRSLVGTSGVESGTTTGLATDSVVLRVDRPSAADFEFTLTLDGYADGGLLTMHDDVFPDSVREWDVEDGPLTDRIEETWYDRELTFGFEAYDVCVDWDFEWSIVDVCPGHRFGENSRTLEGASGIETGAITLEQQDYVTLDAEVPEGAQFAFTVTYDGAPTGSVDVRDRSTNAQLFGAFLDGGSASGVIEGAGVDRSVRLVTAVEGECVEWQVEWSITSECFDDDHEPDGTRATATPLPAPQVSFDGLSAGEGDVDWFVAVVRRSGTIVVEIPQNPAGDRALALLGDTNSDVLAAGVTVELPDGRRVVRATFLNDGPQARQVYARVTAESCGSYRLVATRPMRRPVPPGPPSMPTPGVPPKGGI